jgi:Cell Wall Hydrolase
MTEPAPPKQAPSRRGWAISLVLLLIALMIGSYFVQRAQPVKRPTAVAVGPKGLAVPINLPGIEPIEVPKIAPEEAKKINAAQPFVKEPPIPARPFRLITNAADMNRAVDCMAAAIQYEAGSETLEGKKAVAQVILNRVRHPAYPKTVCGVIFQGSERKTGCQFTFTCDGAINRTLSESGWRLAQDIARSMLTGTVYAPVGWATHYHTDWVFPSWSTKLDKVRQEGTHLFFRWREFWGTPAAFRGRYVGNEGNQPKLAGLSSFHIPEGPKIDLAEGEIGIGLAPPTTVNQPLLPTAPSLPPPPAGAKRTFANAVGDYQLFVVSKSTTPEALLNLSLKACGTQNYCKIMVWTDSKIAPTALPVSEKALAQLSFSYLRNREAGFDKALWNCALFQRSAPGQCIKHQASVAKPAAVPPPAGAAPAGAN